MLQYYLTMEPQLFQSAVDSQLQRLHAEKEAKAAQDAARKSQEEEEAEAAGAEGAADGSKGPERSKSDLVLYQRMEEVRCLCVWFGGAGGWMRGLAWQRD
jgi:hypothetical protein